MERGLSFRTMRSNKKGNENANKQKTSQAIVSIRLSRDPKNTNKKNCSVSNQEEK